LGRGTQGFGGFGQPTGVCVRVEKTCRFFMGFQTLRHYYFT
jgi:hypothetical protein